jgi:DNA-binding MarR family transcriptional regulator
MTEGSGRSPDQADLDILDSVAELFGFLVGQGERLARRLGVPLFFVKALHLLDRPMAMKDLGRRMHCDPSFVTGIADMMEKRGLAVREPDPADRRVKRLMLTEAGEDLRRQVEAEMLAALPWRKALDAGERACLAGHIAAMISVLKKEAAGGPVPPAPASANAEEVSARLTLAPPAT